jgi:hypothetical protein
MQLQLTLDELKLVAEILEKRGAELVSTTREQERLSNLLDKIAAWDLRFDCDELQDLEDVLAQYTLDDLDQKYGPDDAERKKQMLSRIIDKVTEARVMA